MWNLIKILFIISAVWQRGIIGVEATKYTPNAFHISIQLNDTFRLGEINFYREYEIPGSSVTTIEVRGTDELWDVGFGIFQTHSFLYNITLSAKKSLRSPSVNAINGTNLGFNVHHNSTYFLHTNGGRRNVSVAVAFVVFKKTGAIPGSCNMVHPVEETPFLRVNILEDTVMVETPPAGSGVPRLDNMTCGTENFLYEFRYMYLARQDFSQRSYFDSLRALMVPRTIVELGNLVTKVPEYNLHQLYARYTSMGMFFTTLVMDGLGENITTAYVPAHSYGCSEQLTIHDCHIVESTSYMILLVLIMVLGACQVILGRQLVYLRVIVNSFMIGGYLAFVIFCTVDDWDLKVIIMIVGVIVFSVVWTTVWLQCHSVSNVADILGSFLNGYTVACLVLYMFGDMKILESESYYWMVFCLVIPSVSVLSFPLSRRGAIVNTALLGSTFMALTLLFMFDGNLHYAIINNWRRLKDKSFSQAILNPHLDIVDCFCIAVWLMAFASSIFIQTRLIDSGCACWGPHNVRVLRFRDQEARPLIARLTKRDLGSDDVFLSPRSNSRFMRRFKRHSFFV
ncbi:transmembrane 7 superfamily member 3-like [Phlebotomus argentipes]|uniref:transmembrane 7 superfamily member 3-like n=1 Tax=Phlebotomus argentipes TaxID=94469 RepID=UPI002892F779|nr:transmembrane 7 superfamily member 3-like [Phlebotomus argentipes]